MLKKDSLTQSLCLTEYKKEISLLREKLFDKQRQFRDKRTSSLLLVVGGFDGIAKHDTTNTIANWMDPRGLSTYDFSRNIKSELERPEFWKYWKTLPAKGEIRIYLGAWYDRPFYEKAYRNIDLKKYERYLSRIEALEKQLALDGTIIIKLWISISKSEYIKRIHNLKEDPLKRWCVSKTDEKQALSYEQFKNSSDHLLEKTNYSFCKWHLIEGDNAKRRTIAVAQVFENLLNCHQNRRTLLKKELKSTLPKKNKNVYVTTSKLDLGKHLDKSAYKKKIEKYRRRLHELSIQMIKKDLSTVIVFEGVDAAGKGGAIQRMIVAFDAPRYRVIPISKPNEEESKYHYLWRFWKHVPTTGMITIFDRSYYGRVLVERIEEFATKEEWNRAYSEINDFEEQLLENNTAVIKFWIQISKDEQLKRFRARQNNPHKNWKINEEDWRNREKWEQYEEASRTMIELTSTDFAPWTIVEGNDKRFARVKVIKTVCQQLEKAINGATV